VTARYECQEHRRLRVVKQAGLLGGIEYLEVYSTPTPTDPLAQRTLLVRLLRPASVVAAADVTIDGGERIRTVGVEWVAPADALPAGEDPAIVAGLSAPANVLVVRTTEPGDFSYYKLHIATAGFDPRLASVEFSFKIDCASPFDCWDVCMCGQRWPDAPEIDYLAKDYASLRRMLLDRLALITPGWRERNAADLGMVLVELMAYEGDRLSYAQDAVATEAFLGTARRRVSLRRHARLVDYRMHEGCSARALMCVTPEADAVTLPAGTAVYTRTPGLGTVLDAPGEQAAIAAGATAFETTIDTLLYIDHEVLNFYAWGDEDCCLPAGATAATLREAHPNLRAGDILIFAEVLDPQTGEAADADPARRHAVRLTSVTASQDLSGGQFLEPQTSAPVDVTEIEWDAADALPFAVCVSAKAAAGPVSVAYGNVVVADHGRTMPAETLGVVPAPYLYVDADTPVSARYRPRLRFGPLARSVDVTAAVLATPDSDAGVQADLAAGSATTTVRDWLANLGVTFTRSPVVVRGGGGVFSVSDGATVVGIRPGTGADAGRLVVTGRPMPAVGVTAATPTAAIPALRLAGTPPGGGDETWTPRFDLLGSTADATDFVVETETDATAYLRFGDGTATRGYGRRPVPGTTFTATYRVGNAVAGNVGAGTLAHIATSAGVIAVTNPLAAAGGTEPETADEVRRDAPAAFLTQERAVTKADWQDVAARDPAIQRAAASWRWTGSWHTVFLTVDRAGGAEVDPAFAAAQRARLERYRLAGYDLELDGPQYVPLELAVSVCVRDGYLRSAVRAELLAAIGALFAPDRLTFAQPAYLSPVLAAAQAVPGVTSVVVDVFRRQQDTAVSGLDSGVLTMGRLEVARLDNDPNFPEHGVLTLSIGGGQ
jgi:Baseplate J-like protein